MPRSCSPELAKIIMPPLCPTSATGPCCSVSGRSSVSVTSLLLAQTLPMQLGPDTPRPVSSISADSSRPSAAASVSKDSPKPAENTVALRAPAAAPAAQCFDHARCRHQHDQMVGRLGQRLEIRIAGLVPDFRAARIDQMDRPRKFIAVEVAPHPRRPASRTVAGADQDDVARRRERFDFLLRGFEIQVWPPPLTRQLNSSFLIFTSCRDCRVTVSPAKARLALKPPPSGFTLGVFAGDRRHRRDVLHGGEASSGLPPTSGSRSAAFRHSGAARS